MAEVKFSLVEIKDIESKTDGKKFKAYKVLAKNGKKMDCRFVTGCQNVPTEPCTIVCDEEECNVDTTRMYPILWVKNVLRTEERVRKSNLGEYFDI